MRRLRRPSWSSLGNRNSASRGSADLLFFGVRPKSEQFPLDFVSFYCEDVLCLKVTALLPVLLLPLLGIMDTGAVSKVDTDC